MKKFLSFINSKGFMYFALLFMAVILFTHADHRFGYTSAKEKDRSNIVADGTGYYAYLPKHIIYGGDKKYSFLTEINKKYPNKYYSTMLYVDGVDEFSNKFYPGTALLQSPFFTVAHWYQKSQNTEEADGYALPYRLSITIASIFYWFIGALALILFLLKLNIIRSIALLAIGIITFGTNLNYFTAIIPSMSHVYSFSLVSLFLLVSLKWVKSNKSRDIFLIGLILGLIFIVRPINVLAVLILPFLFTDFKAFIERLKLLLNLKNTLLLMGIIGVILPIFFFFAERFYTSGSIAIYTYQKEGFDNLFTPQIINVLFSYRRGFFTYAPVLYLSLIGIIFMYLRTSRWFFFGWLTTIFVWIYLISSWWCWDYGGSFGMRAMIETLPLFTIPLAFLIQNSSNQIRYITIPFIAIGIYIFQIFQIQFNKDIIHFNEMDKERYWKIFLKTDDRYIFIFHFNYEILPSDGNYKSIGTINYNTEKWQWNKADVAKHSNVSLDSIPDGIHLKNVWKNPVHFQFTGKTTLSDQSNNPFVKVYYYQDTLVIKETLTPFGSQIEDINKSEHFKIEFNPPKVWDSCKIELHHGGNINPYDKFVFRLLEKTN